MKLRDLVANSLPRVRGRKKKTTPVVGTASASHVPSSNAPVATPKIPVDAVGYRKSQSHCSMIGSPNGSRDSCLEGQDISEASWRGNALYKGLERERAAVEIDPRMMSSSYTSSHGIVASHSADGFSTQLMMMSRSYDSRMAVSEYNGSCSQMAAISEASVEPYSAKQQQQHYHCHYHHYNLHHHYHHHISTIPMAPLVQNQQKMHQNPFPDKCNGSYKASPASKSDKGFFRKSIASFRNIGKQSNKVHRDCGSNTKPSGGGGAEQMRCSVCPYPETTISSTERKSSEKRPSKPKRKGLKGFSRFKENKEVLPSDKCDQSWYSDSEAHHAIASPDLSRINTCIPTFTPYDRERERECSAESCSSRIYDSREGSCVREIDFANFDSASLSGYESDLPRNKVHMSRSRIKTNPWLPSPQPSLSGGRRGDSCNLRESKEDIAAIEDHASRVTRSASFDLQTSRTKLFQMPGLGRNNSVQRHRSLTPVDLKATLNLTKTTKSPLGPKTPTWLSVEGSNIPDAATKLPPQLPAVLNDLNSDPPRSRPTSIVSPNTEFVMLADNIEQLANNISFEYEEMLDSTLESVSVCQEDGQASIQELLTDEENGSGAKKSPTSFLKSSGIIHNAHSPDSGIGGLGSSDGDDSFSTGVQNELKVVPMDCLMAAKTSPFNRNGNKITGDCPVSGEFLGSVKGSQPKALNNECQDNGYKMEAEASKLSGTPFKSSEGFDDDSATTISESDIDNASYHDYSSRACAHTDNGFGIDMNNQGSSLPKCKSEACGLGRSSSLMINERLDIQFQPLHRNFYGCGVVMGTGASIRENRGQVKCSSLLESLPNRHSDPTDFLLRRAARPNALMTNPNIHGNPKRLNDMEKVSGKADSERPWLDEFDFPRNIPLLECVESPTENWQCDGQLSMCSSQDTVILEQGLGAKLQVCCSNPEDDKGKYVSDCMRNDDFVGKVDDTDTASMSQHTVEMASENTSLLDCNMDKLETDLPDTNFEMNDACVQTDFDDEFSRWDEADTLESLDDNAIDPAESTRIWLLTGNMQGSADTGYSSLTRDSQILMDEDTLFLAGELEERAAAERLSFGEHSNQICSNEKTLMNPAFLEITPGNMIIACDRQLSLSFEKEASAKLAAGHVKGPLGGTFTQLPKKDDAINPPELNVQASGPKCGQKTGALRAIPQSTVNQMFSNIESQFQEIFQQIYNNRKPNSGPEVKGKSPDSSRSNIKLCDSTCPVASGTMLLGTPQCAPNKSEIHENKMKTRLRSHDKSEKKKFTDHDYANVPSSKHIARQGSTCRPDNLGATPCRTGTNGNLTRDDVKNKADRPFGACRNPKIESGELKESSSALCADAGPDRADYLEFLRDAPLDRSHLKRPLFLVPGIGPVDMSSSEQVNLFTESNFRNGEVTLISNAPPSTAHSGKKLRCHRQHGKDWGQSRHLTDASNSPSKERQEDGSCDSKCDHFPELHLNQQAQGDNGAYKEEALKSLPELLSKKMAMPKCHAQVQQCKLKTFKPQSPPSSTSAATDTPSPSTTSSSSMSSSASSSSSSSSLSRSLVTGAGPAQVDEATRSLAERVISLRREKDIIYRKIQEAQQDELSRQEQRLQLRRTMNVQRKEALLETLQELRERLEEQKRRLKLNETS